MHRTGWILMILTLLTVASVVDASPAEDAEPAPAPAPVPVDADLLKGEWMGDMAVKKGEHRDKTFTAQFTLEKGDFSSVTGLAMVEIVSSRGRGVRGRKVSFELTGQSTQGRKVPFRFIGTVSDDGTTMEGNFSSRIAAGTFRFHKQD